jgi:hypothetical protein
MVKNTAAAIDRGGGRARHRSCAAPCRRAAVSGERA